MNSYLAQGLQNGFGLGWQAVRDRQKEKKDAELQLARQQFEEGLLDKRLSADASSVSIEKELREKRLAADAQRFAEEQNNPQNVLARRKAQRELDQFDNPPPVSPEDQMTADIRRLKLQKERDSLMAPPAATPVPTAKVRRNLGADGKGGYAEFEIPQTDLEKTMGGLAASSYKSPYADQITALQSSMAKQQAEIAGGDTRTGFMGIGTSRTDLVNKSNRQLLQLQAMELKDMVSKGVISAEEADRRANALMDVK